MDDPTAAWLAGLFDGEGSFFLNRADIIPMAVISNTDERLMDALLERIKMGRVFSQKRSYDTRPFAYAWRLNRTEQRLIIPDLLDWLVVKREQAELLLQVLTLKAQWRNGRTDPAQHRSKLIAARAQMQQLNRTARPL